MEKSIPSKADLEREFLRWRSTVKGGDHENPLVTFLSHNEFEDKISLVLVPLLASAGVRILKFIWSDEPSGQALRNNLQSIPGVLLPSNPEDIHRVLERTGGVFASLPETSPLQDKAHHRSGSDKMSQFKESSLFAIYAVRWNGVAADIRVGNYSHQINTLRAHDLAMDLKEHCDAAGLGSSFFLINQNQPLGSAFGPVFELQEALDVLQAKGPFDLIKMTLEIGADLLMFHKQFPIRTEAKAFLKERLLSGAAHARFKEIIQALKKEEVLEKLFTIPLAGRVFRILSPRTGYIERIAMDRLCDLKKRLCRQNQDAGIRLHKKIGDTTEVNETLATVYLASSWNTELLQIEGLNIFAVSRFPPKFEPQVSEKIKGSFRF